MSAMEGWKTALIATGGAIGGLALLAPAIFWFEVLRLEKPKYEVVRGLGKKHSLTGRPQAELRRYGPMLVAEVTVTSDTMRENASSGFRQIAGFIFGKNLPNTASQGVEGEKIAMTSPVRMEMIDMDAKDGEKIAMTSPVRMDMVDSTAGSTDGGTVRMSFVMPSKYTKETLPRPKNQNVQIKEVPGHMAAALGFSGWIRNKVLVEKKKQQLLDLLKEEGLEAEGEVMLYQYHPPFMYGFLRHNEVLFNIKDPAAAPAAEPAKKK